MKNEVGNLFFEYRGWQYCYYYYYWCHFVTIGERDSVVFRPWGRGGTLLSSRKSKELLLNSHILQNKRIDKKNKELCFILCHFRLSVTPSAPSEKEKKKKGSIARCKNYALFFITSYIFVFQQWEISPQIHIFF